MSKTILVIDDDAAVRKSFQLALEDLPYIIDLAESGEVGLQKLQNTKYDLIFLDLKMPGMSGTETLSQLRTIDAEVPVYIVTAFHKEFIGDLQDIRQSGIKFELLRKPLGIEEILTIVKVVFRE